MRRLRLNNIVSEKFAAVENRASGRLEAVGGYARAYLSPSNSRKSAETVAKVIDAKQSQKGAGERQKC